MKMKPDTSRVKVFRRLVPLLETTGQMWYRSKACLQEVTFSLRGTNTLICNMTKSVFIFNGLVTREEPTIATSTLLKGKEVPVAASDQQGLILSSFPSEPHHNHGFIIILLLGVFTAIARMLQWKEGKCHLIPSKRAVPKVKR